jgi:hypothetical protein
MASDACLEAAARVRSIYAPGFAFPEWVLTRWNQHDFASATVLYHAADSLSTVQKLATEREPCNIAMRRMYDQAAMQAAFGWRTGAYAATTSEATRMPNFAVVCRAHVLLGSAWKPVWVLNLIGVAHDSPEQPDALAYRGKEAVLAAYAAMWALAVGAVNMLFDQGHISAVAVYNVGGGAFCGSTFENFVTECFEPTFLPAAARFRRGVRLLGYDERTKQFYGGMIPNVLARDDASTTLYINAWDPWSLIGNGNASDDSLDGFWGRSSNLAVLGWPVTNPRIKWRAV